jgi:hypothetical protein
MQLRLGFTLPPSTGERRKSRFAACRLTPEKLADSGEKAFGSVKQLASQ